MVLTLTNKIEEGQILEKLKYKKVRVMIDSIPKYKDVVRHLPNSDNKNRDG